MPEKSLKGALRKIRVLADTDSKNEKIELLKEYLEDELFELVAVAALDETVHYNVKKWPDWSGPGQVPNLETAFLLLNDLSTKNGASDDEKEALFDSAAVDEETYEVIRMITAKTLGCNVSAKSINKAKKGTVFVVPYQRCSSSGKLPKIPWPAFAQKKSDGTFSDMFPSNGGKCLTRKGNKFDFLGIFEAKCEAATEADVAFTGELLVRNDDGSIMSREQGNGIINKALKGTITEEECDRVFAEVWDVIPVEDFWAGKYKSPLSARVNWMNGLLEGNTDIIATETDIVHSEEEALEHFVHMVSLGFEGSVIKDKSGIWKDGTSTKQVKLKEEKVAEFEIIDWYYGEPNKEFEHCLGGITVATSDRGIICNVGTGFTDEERGLGLPKETLKAKMDGLIGGITSIKFNYVCKDKDRPETDSLFLPRNMDRGIVRIDKDVADTTAYVKKVKHVKKGKVV